MTTRLKHCVLAAAAAFSLTMSACGGRAASVDRNEVTSSDQAAAAKMACPAFSGDSAYRRVAEQVAMGPRMPGSEGHRACAQWIAKSLKDYGVDTVIVTNDDVVAFTGEKFVATNILGRISPDKADRILLLAHWDTRPWADNDPDEAMRKRPLPGANDGASGVGVLLELARVLGASRPEVGVDLLFVDMEDMGESDPWRDTEATWCLGTQRWVEKMPYGASERPRFGILLDMVGGTDACFHREQLSDYFAPSVVNKVWAKAKALGLQDRFPNERGGSVVDDHLYVNRAGIPCVDIIENQHPATGTFNPTWHTLSDDMASISPATLGAVGRVVTAVIWDEKTSNSGDK